MKNTSKKLLLSVFVLLFAVVAVATTSFAWFTISGKARVDEFQLNITTGEGIQVQLTTVGGAPTADGWRNVITAADLQAVLNYQSLRLEHLTSVDAQNFHTLQEGTTPGHYIDTTDVADLATSDLLQFELHFRANQPYEIHLTEESKVVSSLMELKPAWARTYDPDGEGAGLPVKQEYSTYAANAMRVGFVFNSGANYPIWAPTDENADYQTNREYGYKNTVEPRNFALDGAWEFFNDYMHSVNVGDPESTVYLPNTPTEATQIVFGNQQNTEDDQALVTLTTATGDIALEGGAVFPFTQYEKMTIRIWLEGWDGDCYNVIYNGAFNTTLAFEGKLAA